jgi:hypothetical protein
MTLRCSGAPSRHYMDCVRRTENTPSSLVDTVSVSRPRRAVMRRLLLCFKAPMRYRLACKPQKEIP